MSRSINAPSMREALVGPGYAATKRMQDWMNAVTTAVPSFTLLFLPDFGVAGGGKNSTAALQAAINQAAANGGGTVFVPAGLYRLDSVTFPVGIVPITISGAGASTIFQRASVLAAGHGMFDVYGSNVSFDHFLIDGAVTVPVGLLYNVDFTGIGANDPMADSLTRNSSIWVHGGASNFTCTSIAVQHTGGYAALIDGGTSGISDVQFFNCYFLNNRPNLFGVTAGAAIYGSWTGGIYVNGDGRAANPGCVVKRLTIAGCRFQRGTGNQIWSHLYGLDELHEAFEFTSNYFLDIGLDGILVGGVTGGVVSQNDFRRIGYVCLTDDDRGTPRWLPNLNATALDSSGLVKGVNYQGNSFLSVNGGNLDLDGHSDSSLIGNTARIPYPGEPEFDEDQIAISGIANAGSTTYGVNLGNTSNTVWGGKNVTIAGNTLLNLSAGAVRLYSARNCLVSANDIVAPDQPIAPPISLGPGGPGANQRSTGNVIKHNRFSYSPATPQPFVFEDPSVAPFVATDVNYVFGNCPIIGPSGLATEFQPNGSSGSPHYLETVWFT